MRSTGTAFAAHRVRGRTSSPSWVIKVSSAEFSTRTALQRRVRTSRQVRPRRLRQRGRSDPPRHVSRPWKIAALMPAAVASPIAPDNGRSRPGDPIENATTIAAHGTLPAKARRPKPEPCASSALGLSVTRSRTVRLGRSAFARLNSQRGTPRLQLGWRPRAWCRVAQLRRVSTRPKSMAITFASSRQSTLNVSGCPLRRASSACTFGA